MYCKVCRNVPFSHEENPLIGEQTQTRQAREAKQRQGEEEYTWTRSQNPEQMRACNDLPSRFWNPAMSFLDSKKNEKRQQKKDLVDSRNVMEE